MDYYTILNISRDASKSDIKKAYVQLARSSHPDKDSSNTGFWKINEAYKTLSDPNLKKEYDEKYSDPGLFSNINIQNLFNNKNNLQSAIIQDFIYNNIDKIMSLNFQELQTKMLQYFKENFKKLREKYNIDIKILTILINSILNFTIKPTLVKPDNIRYTINVTLEQIFLSKKRKLQILRKIKCKKCNGNGSIYKCNKCNHFYNSFINVCENCCKFSNIKLKCDCNNGLIEDTKIHKVRLDDSILHNTQLTFKNQGDFLQNYEYQGDIDIYINYIENDIFSIVNKIHLETTVYLSLYEWIYEYNITIYHPNNSKIPLNNKGVINNTNLTIPNKGLIYNKIKGNLYVNFKLDYNNINKSEIYKKFQSINKYHIKESNDKYIDCDKSQTEMSEYTADYSEYSADYSECMEK